MQNHKKLIALSLVASIAISGCMAPDSINTPIKQNQKDKNTSLVSEQCGGFIAGTIGGTAIGAAIGAGIGNLIGQATGANQTVSTVVGGVVGAGLGYLVGSGIDDRRKELCIISQETNTKVIMTNITNVNIDDSNITSQSQIKIQADAFAIPDTKFKKGSSDLEATQQDALKKFAQTYKKYDSDKKILIIGNTDNSGLPAENQKLSEARAKAVAEIFEAQGIPKQNLYYQGAGSSMPIASNSTEEGKKLNRRTEIASFDNETDLQKAVDNRRPNQNYVDSGIKVVKSKDLKNSQSKQAKEQTQQDATQNKNAQNKQNELEKNSIDFSGASQSSAKPVSSMIGVPITGRSWFENIIPSAYASGYMPSYMVSCVNDKPQVNGSVKKLSNNEKLKSRDDAKFLMYKRAWGNMQLNNNGILLSPIEVSKSGQVSTNPTVYIYKDSSKTNSETNATIAYQSSASAIDGSNGLLYRVYPQGDGIQCLDVYVPNGSASGKAEMYYKKQNKQLVKQFPITAQ